MNSLVPSLIRPRVALFPSIGMALFWLTMQCSVLGSENRQHSELTRLVQESESISLVTVLDVDKRGEAHLVRILGISALKGEVPSGVVSYGLSMKPLLRDGTYPVKREALVFLKRNATGTLEPLTVGNGKQPQMNDLFWPVFRDKIDRLPEQWCNGSISRRVICLLGTPLMAEESMGFGMGFLDLTRGDSDPDLKAFWSIMQETAPYGRGYALSQRLFLKGDDAICDIEEIFLSATSWEQSSIQARLTGEVRPLRLEPIDCLGKIARDQSLPLSLRQAAATAVHATHSPATGAILAQFARSNEEMLQRAGAIGLSALALGLAPNGVETKDLPRALWRLEAPESAADFAEGMLGMRDGDQPALSRTALFWANWYDQHREMIQKQVAASAAEGAR